MNKEDIGDPDLLHQPAIEGHALVAGAKEGQPLILPIMPQVQGHGEILGEPGVRPDRNGLESFLPYNPLPSSTAVTNTPWLPESEVWYSAKAMALLQLEREQLSLYVPHEARALEWCPHNI